MSGIVAIAVSYHHPNNTHCDTSCLNIQQPTGSWPNPYKWRRLRKGTKWLIFLVCSDGNTWTNYSKKDRRSRGSLSLYGANWLLSSWPNITSLVPIFSFLNRWASSAREMFVRKQKVFLTWGWHDELTYVIFIFYTGFNTEAGRGKIKICCTWQLYKNPLCVSSCLCL